MGVVLRKSTKIWLAVFAVALLTAAINSSVGSYSRSGCLQGLAVAAAVISGAVLLARATAAVFRGIVRRLTLRLAFSYFLIGIVPIPLLAMLLFCVGYLFAWQIVAGRVMREVTAIAEQATMRTPGVQRVRVEAGKVVESGIPWLPKGTPVEWESKLSRPAALLNREDIWLIARKQEGDSTHLFLIPFKTESASQVQLLADRAGYAIQVNAGEARRKEGKWNIDVKSRRGDESRDGARESVRPADKPKEGNGLREGEWIFGLHLEPVVASFGRTPKGDDEENVVAFIVRTSPRTLYQQLFAQGIPDIGKYFWVILVGLAGALLLVYLVALVIAFVLVGSIARNVNRLTRATQAAGRGDFSVRVNSKSRDQIGDLARSFDGMASSIERLLVDTAKKERLEAEIAIARTIQQKLLPPPEASLDGLKLMAHFEPVAEIGGDYYDYFTMPDGRTAVVVGDVSGHGLPTGLLVAMAKAALSTLIESGLKGPALFARLNELIYRSTDSRNYMTLALFAWDESRRQGELINAGQLAPYRISSEGVESLSLPSFPLGVSARSDFPSRTQAFSSGDRLLFVTDGFVEATSPSGDPFGFERLEAVLKSEAGSDARRIRETLVSAIASHTGGSAPDDDRTSVLLSFE